MNEYLQSLYNIALGQKIRLGMNVDLDILRAYKQAGDELVDKFRRSKEGSAIRAYYASYIRGLHDDILRITDQYGIKAATIPASMMQLMTEDIFKNAGITDANFGKAFGKIPYDVMRQFYSGDLYKDGVGLSDRIWGYAKSSGANLQKIIAAGQAQQLSATELSKVLQDYVNPEARKLWDNDKIKNILGDGYATWNNNLEYNALRLARTTITHSAELSLIASCKNNPYVEGIKWHLSSSHSSRMHGRTDICDTWAEQNGYGMGAGVYPMDKVPFDHPNGLCWQEAFIPKSLDEIGDDLVDWLNNGKGQTLNQWRKDHPTLFDVIAKAFDANDYKIITQAEIEDKVNQFYSKLSGDDRDAIGHYVRTGNSFSLNEYLYTGNYDNEVAAGLATKSRYLEQIDNFSAVINKDKLTDSMQLVRNVDTNTMQYIFKQGGIKMSDKIQEGLVNIEYGTTEEEAKALADELTKSLAGVKYNNQSFISTSFNAGANVFKGRPVQIEFYADKGTKALMTDNWAESEVVFDKDTRIEILGFTTKQMKEYGRIKNILIMQAKILK